MPCTAPDTACVPDLRPLLRTSTFRLTLAYLAVVLASVIGILAVVTLSTAQEIAARSFSFESGMRGRPHVLALRLGARHAGLDALGAQRALELRPAGHDAEPPPHRVANHRWAVQFTLRARDTVLQSCAAFDSVSSPARCPKNSTL